MVVESRSGVRRVRMGEGLPMKAQHELLVVMERQSNPDGGRVFNSSVHVIKFHRTIHPPKRSVCKNRQNPNTVCSLVSSLALTPVSWF